MNTSIKTQSRLTACILAAGLFALGFGASGAQAAERFQSLTKVVAYGDLNLDSQQGAKVLYARLRNAARTVCHPLEGRDLNQIALWRGCVDQAVSSAVVQINKTSVTALHNQFVNRSAKS
jgi:UrcA family protein